VTCLHAVVRRASVLLAIAWLGVAPASATSPRSPLLSLAREADTIVLGVCTSTRSAWDEQHRWIVTTAEVRTQRTFKGRAADTVTVRLLGGRVGDVEMIASKSATLLPGEQAILFLRQSRFGPYHVVAGGQRGTLPVAIDPQSGEVRLRGAMSIGDFQRLIDRAADE